MASLPALLPMARIARAMPLHCPCKGTRQNTTGQLPSCWLLASRQPGPAAKPASARTDGRAGAGKESVVQSCQAPHACHCGLQRHQVSYICRQEGRQGVREGGPAAAAEHRGWVPGRRRGSSSGLSPLGAVCASLRWDAAAAHIAQGRACTPAASIARVRVMGAGRAATAACRLEAASGPTAP